MLNARSMTIKISRIDSSLVHYMQFVPNRTSALPPTKAVPPGKKLALRREEVGLHECREGCGVPVTMQPKST